MHGVPVLVMVPGGPGAQPVTQPLPPGAVWWQILNGGPADAQVYMQVDGKLLHIETIPTKSTGTLHPAAGGQTFYGVTSTGATSGATAVLLYR